MIRRMKAFASQRFNRVGIALLGGLAGLCLHLGLAVAQEAQAVSGTIVTMTPPEGFVAASDFTGFANVEKQGSFLVAEFPAEAAGQLGGLFADEATAAANFATKGITVSSREEIDNTDGDTIPLLRGTQEANGQTLEKWMALYAGEKVVMITFQIPQENALAEDAMKAAFASVKLAGAEESAAPEGDPRLAELPYSLDVVEPFRLASVTNGTGALLTVGEKDVDPEATQPQIIVTYTETSAPKSDLKRIADVVLNAIGDNVAIESQEEEMFAGLDGLVTKGAFEENGVKKRFAQWVAYTEAGAPIQVLGTAAIEKYGELSDAIDEVAGSVEMKE